MRRAQRKSYQNGSVDNSPVSFYICFHRTVFNRVSKVIRNCFGFSLLRSVIGLKKLAPPSQPIRCKTNTNRDLVTRVLPRLPPVTCICSEFSLVHCVVYVVVIGHSQGHSNCFGFGFTTLNWKPLYKNYFHSHVHFHASQTHFHLNGFAPRLVLKQRQKLGNDFSLLRAQPPSWKRSRPW